MLWVTRPRCHVDRTACAWVIRRFVDRDATFAFGPDLDSARALGGTPFDMRGVDLSHHDGDCTFETILQRYSLEDPVLWELARLVHEADLADERFDEPDAPGLDAVCRGLALVKTDAETLVLAGAIFDGLYEQRRRVLLGDA